MQPVQKNNCITKPGIERLLFLAVGFKPATVHSRELYAPAGRRLVKVDIYIHRTKATSYTRLATSSKNSCITKPGVKHLLFLAVAFEPATVHSTQLHITTERRTVKVDIYIHRTKATSYTNCNQFKKQLHNQTWKRTPIIPCGGI